MGYLGPDIYCFAQCPPTGQYCGPNQLRCQDNQPGYNVYCKGTGSYCGVYVNDPCQDELEICGYDPILTLSVNLTAFPNSGTAPLYDVDLSANVSGTATGKIVYRFSCHNDTHYEHTSVATTTNPYSIDNLCDYTTAGPYTAKVQVTRGGLTATDRTTITVSAPSTLFVDLTAFPNSGTAPLYGVDLDADVSGTATGNIVYRFDCTNNGTWEHTSAATTTDPYSFDDFCDYTTDSTYTAKVQVTRDGLTATDTTTITVSAPSNDPPNAPTLIAPPQDTWINYDPTFKVGVSDPNNDSVAAYFLIYEYTYAWGGWAVNGGVSSLGPVNLGTCAAYWWSAAGYDEHGLWGNWSYNTYGWWYTKIDKGIPTAAISYAATSEQLTFPVTLTESDACSGISIGDVEVRYKKIYSPIWSAYQDYSKEINNFTYTGENDYQYQFRYRVKDLANNWSNYVEGGIILVDLNDPPTATNLSYVASDVCYQPAPFYTFRWTYSDPEIDKQSRYILQIDNNSDFSSLQVNMDITGLSDPSPSIDSQSIIVATQPSANQLAFNTTYYWRVRVYDEHSLPSNWTNGVPFSFTTPVHHYPACDFTWSPNQPNADETVNFTDTSRCWDEDPINGSDCSISKGDAYLWTITSGDPSSSTSENASASFSLPGNYDVILQVTDSDGHACSTTKSVRVNYPVPKWKEILPW